MSCMLSLIPSCRCLTERNGHLRTTNRRHRLARVVFQPITSWSTRICWKTSTWTSSTLSCNQLASRHRTKRCQKFAGSSSCSSTHFSSFQVLRRPSTSTFGRASSIHVVISLSSVRNLRIGWSCWLEAALLTKQLSSQTTTLKVSTRFWPLSNVLLLTINSLAIFKSANSRKESFQVHCTSSTLIRRSSQTVSSSWTKSSWLKAKSRFAKCKVTKMVIKIRYNNRTSHDNIQTIPGWGDTSER